MKKIMSALIATIGLGACSINPFSEESAQLQNWTLFGDAVWQFGPSGATARGGSSVAYLVSPQQYDDFRLQVDFWVEDETNSGVFIRCEPPKDITDLNPARCLEINIWDNHPNQAFRTGSIVTLVEPAVRGDSAD